MFLVCLCACARVFPHMWSQIICIYVVDAENRKCHIRFLTLYRSVYTFMIYMYAVNLHKNQLTSQPYAKIEAVNWLYVHVHHSDVPLNYTQHTNAHTHTLTCPDIDTCWVREGCNADRKANKKFEIKSKQSIYNFWMQKAMLCGINKMYTQTTVICIQQMHHQLQIESKTEFHTIRFFYWKWNFET